MRRRTTWVAVVLLVGGLLAGCQIPGTVLSGRLTIDGAGTPAAGATVTVYDDTTETVLAQTVADSDGRYAFNTAQLPDGGYRLRLSPTEWWQDATTWATATPLAVATATPVTVDAAVIITTGSLTGQVDEGAGPLPDVTVEAVSTVTGAVIATTTSDPGGAYAFDPLATGTYRLRYRATGYANLDAAATHTVTEGSATAADPATLEPESILTGIVTEGGAPAAGILVVTRPGPTGALLITTTDANGAFAFRGLSDDAHPIILGDPTPTLTLVAAQADGAPLAFTPEPGHDLHLGTIDLATGAVIPVGFTSFDEGVFHACALELDQTMACWGANYYGHSDPPAGTFTKLSTFADQTCAIRTDGAMTCMGTDGYFGAAAPLPGTYTDVHVGGSWDRSQVCGIDGTRAIFCRSGSATTSPIAGTFSALGTGSSFLTCAIRTVQTIGCWGSNSQGQASPPPGTFRSVTNGSLHACGLTTHRALTCWGDDYFGQTDAPTGEFLALSAGRVHTCALAIDLSVHCWGDTTMGQLNAPEGTFVEVVANGDRTCAASTGGDIVCWGDIGFGTQSPTAGSFVAASANNSVLCTLDEAGSAACWGAGQPGATTTPPAGTFTTLSSNWRDFCAIDDAGTISCWGSYNPGPPTPPTGEFRAIDAGNDHWCAIAVDHTLACWGANTSGKATPPTGSYIQVSAGPEHTCAIADDGTLACWGDNAYGETAPPPGTYADVAAGTRHSCAIDSAGAISCWGDSTGGRTAAPAGTFVDVEIAESSTCAVSTDGSIRCWGPSIFVYYGTPTPPTTGSFTSITSSGGNNYSFCATRSDGAYQCWGRFTVIGWLYD